MDKINETKNKQKTYYITSRLVNFLLALLFLLAIPSANFFHVTVSASENSHVHKGEKEKHIRKHNIKNERERSDESIRQIFTVSTHWNVKMGEG